MNNVETARSVNQDETDREQPTDMADVKPLELVRNERILVPLDNVEV